MISEKLTEAKKLIGTEKMYEVNTISFPVKIVDVVQTGMFINYKIVPLHGKGSDLIRSFSKITKSSLRHQKK